MPPLPRCYCSDNPHQIRRRVQQISNIIDLRLEICRQIIFGSNLYNTFGYYITDRANPPRSWLQADFQGLSAELRGSSLRRSC
jgi:hypothetical protein